MKQRPLFNELPMKLKKLTDKDIDTLANKYFGNADNYLHDEIRRFARAIERKIQGKNK